MSKPNTRQLAGILLILAAIALGIAIYGNSILSLTPTDEIVECSAWGKEDGICVTTVGNTRSMFRPTGRYEYSFQGYEGSDAFVYVGDRGGEDETAVVLNLRKENLDLKMASKDVGVGSPCEVQVSVKRGIMPPDTNSDQIWTSSGPLPPEAYPDGAPEGSWLKGTLIDNPTYTGRSERIYLYDIDGDSFDYYCLKPYICKTDYYFPAIDPADVPPYVTKSGKVWETTALIYDVKIRIFNEDSTFNFMPIIGIAALLIVGIFLVVRR